jgi:hypothetical protein
VEETLEFPFEATARFRLKNGQTEVKAIRIVENPRKNKFFGILALKRQGRFIPHRILCRVFNLLTPYRRTFIPEFAVA